MRRIETYVGQQVYEWMFSAQAQNTMVALSKLTAALFGTSALINGLACAPTAPASMTVEIGPGEIYQIEPLEATACGTLPQDTAHSVLKQGVQLDTYTTPVFAAPSTSGQSINYLIEAQYQDSDISVDPTSDASPVVLQFYNANNPSQPWAGPNNSGATSNTFRDGVVAYQIKAGIAAATGSQVTPTPDTGWVGLWVVTVPYAATSLTSSNISQYPKSPILPSGILQSILTGNLIYGVDVGSANTVQANFPVPVSTLVDGMAVQVKIAAANTGVTTFTPNPGVISAAPVVGAAHQPLQGGELVIGGRAAFIWRADVSTWVLTECTGGAIQVSPATQSNQAVRMDQLYGELKGQQQFTSSGTFVVPAGVKTLYVSACGGGGGGASGGAGSTSTGNGWAAGGGAGGAGQPIIKVPYAVVPGSTINITIGAAGTGGPISSINNGNNGTAGGNTVISGTGFNSGAAVTLSGGSPGLGGGAQSTAGQFATGGFPGAGYPSGGYGSDTASGVPGGSGGTGAGGPFGGGGAGARTSTTGGISGAGAYGYGSGGGGGSGVYLAGSGNGGGGGSGAPGIAMFEW